MAQFFVLNKPSSYVGLVDGSLIIPTTGIYTVTIQLTENPATSLVVKVKLNGVDQYTSPAFAAQQQNLEIKLPLNCTATDTIRILYASAASIDNQLNTIKSYISIGDGY